MSDFLDEYRNSGPAEENGIVYDSVKVYGWGKTIVNGIQHIGAMFGATVVVPILVSGYYEGAGMTVQQALFFAGLGTLIFQLCTKAKVPAFLGSSFAFLGGYAGVAHMNTGKFASMTMAEKYQYAAGGVVVAGLLYLVLTLLLRLLGEKRVMEYLPPIVTGPIIICIGASLMGSAINNIVKNPFLAFVAIISIVACNVWGKGMIKIIPILMSIVISYAVALVMHFTGMTNPDGTAIMDFSNLAGQALMSAPAPRYLWAKFDLNSSITMAASALPAMVEHIGDINAISSTAKKNYVKDPGLHRTLPGDGLATAIAGFFGGAADTTYGENTGVLAMTKICDPRVMRIAAYGAMLLGLSPVFSVLVSTMPSAIVGGISLVLYGMISSIGIRNLKENDIDFMNSRNLILISVIFSCGVGVTYALPDGVPICQIGDATIALSGLALASILGIFLNAVLNIWSKEGRQKNDYEYGKNPHGDENRGIAINAKDF